MQNISKEALAKLQPHLLNFYKSVRFSLAMVKGISDWLPVYFLAEYDYLPSDQFLKSLFNTHQFRIVSGRIEVTKWESYIRDIQNGGKLTISLEDSKTETVVFTSWKESPPSFIKGLEARYSWKRAWPTVQVNYKGGLNVLDSALWPLMQDAAITYKVPYASIAEAVSNTLGIDESKLEFRSGQEMVHGTVLLPMFASLDSLSYERDDRQSVHVLTRVTYLSKMNWEKLFVSARVVRRDQSVERLQKTSLSAFKVVGPELELSSREWKSAVQAPATAIQNTSFHLTYEGLDSPLPIDEDHLRLVPIVVPESEIERLMTEETDRRELDNLMKIERLLFDGKGSAFEQGMFRLLCRMGFNVAWESRQSRFDLLAVSSNGCLIVECTSDPPSVAQAVDLKHRANSYKNERNPVVVPVLATNLTLLSEVASDNDLIKLEQEVCFMTRDRLKRLLEEVNHESSGRTEKYLGDFLLSSSFKGL